MVMPRKLLDCLYLTGFMRYKLSSPLQMTNGGSDARLDAVDLENMLRGISDHSAVHGELRDSYTQITLIQIESPKTANRIKSPIASSQIESFGA